MRAMLKRARSPCACCAHARLSSAQFDLTQPLLSENVRSPPDAPVRRAALVALLRFSLAVQLDEWALPLAILLSNAAAVHFIFERRPDFADSPRAVLDSLGACSAHPAFVEWATRHAVPPAAIS